MHILREDKTFSPRSIVLRQSASRYSTAPLPLSDISGFGSLLSASKRISAASAVVKVDTRKVVPWPADVREGDMVQVLANIASARLHAISVVRVHDMDTEFDLKLLQSSYRDVVAFLEVRTHADYPVNQ